MADKRRVLITGAAGYIGTFLRNAWAEEYDLVLLDQKDILDATGQFFRGDIQDAELMRKACDGVDTVVHLAATANPGAEFESQVLPRNIVGTHVVFEAAAAAGVKRVIFASSIHCVGGYPPDVQVKWDMPVRPCCDYGASKCYGEALGRYYSDRKIPSVIAVRIGGVHGHREGHVNHDPERFDIVIMESDLVQLLTKCVEAPLEQKFLIVHGVSDNRFKRLDISHTREVLGYEPEDEAGEELEIQEPAPVHPQSI